MQTLKVNLLPPDYRPPRSRAPLYYAAAALLVGAVGATSYTYWSISQEGERLLAEAQGLTAQDQQVQRQLSRAQTIAEKEAAVEQEQALLDGLKGRNWWPVLLEFARRTPQGLSWVTVSGTEHQIVVEGQADRVVNLAEFITGLILAPQVDHVVFHEAMEQETGRYQVRITIWLEGAGPQDGYGLKQERRPEGQEADQAAGPGQEAGRGQDQQQGRQNGQQAEQPAGPQTDGEMGREPGPSEEGSADELAT